MDSGEVTQEEEEHLTEETTTDNEYLKLAASEKMAVPSSVDRKRKVSRSEEVWQNREVICGGVLKVASIVR